jgi:hypothetical protein
MKIRIGNYTYTIGFIISLGVIISGFAIIINTLITSNNKFILIVNAFLLGILVTYGLSRFLLKRRTTLDDKEKYI